MAWLPRTPAGLPGCRRERSGREPLARERWVTQPEPSLDVLEPVVHAAKTRISAHAGFVHAQVALDYLLTVPENASIFSPIIPVIGHNQPEGVEKWTALGRDKRSR
jgi:hypothetical protein